jgi:hypothetical protein
MLYLILPASSESVDEQFPCSAEKKAIFLFMLFRCSSILMASLLISFMYVALVERMVVSPSY